MCMRLDVPTKLVFSQEENLSPWLALLQLGVLPRKRKLKAWYDHSCHLISLINVTQCTLLFDLGKSLLITFVNLGPRTIRMSFPGSNPSK